MQPIRTWVLFSHCLEMSRVGTTKRETRLTFHPTRAQPIQEGHFVYVYEEICRGREICRQYSQPSEYLMLYTTVELHHSEADEAEVQI